MNVILHKNDNGSNVISYVAKGYDIKKIQKQIGGVEISTKSQDIDFDYINAYDISGNTVNLDLEKARELKIKKIRESRDEMFIDFDKRYDIAFKDGIDLTNLKKEREMLKQAPQKAEIYLDSCISFSEIKALSIFALI
ncbi:MAG: hypothetical protein CFH44_00056 [Proteobacteria bacterium]|nr:MAG: hypothetical protein CFH44_00056 [Pseudomonadota bacterium]|tara:strand:- start:776 stop:1189 length:414 start_codon:yes stop_codon:yes gene_type:complete